MRRLSSSPRAVADLEAIRAHLRDRNPEAARRILARLLDAGDLLAEFPGLGRPGVVPGTRAFAVPRTAFVIDYATTDDLVEIASVTHGARRR
jgi:plasmid stabilization system protein ParE